MFFYFCLLYYRCKYAHFYVLNGKNMKFNIIHSKWWCIVKRISFCFTQCRNLFVFEFLPPVTIALVSCLKMCKWNAFNEKLLTTWFYYRLQVCKPGAHFFFSFSKSSNLLNLTVFVNQLVCASSKYPLIENCCFLLHFLKAFSAIAKVK